MTATGRAEVVDAQDGTSAKRARRIWPWLVGLAVLGALLAFRGLGTATAFNTATVKSRVDGQLVSVAAREGQLVREGEVLAQIDPRPYASALAQAQALRRTNQQTVAQSESLLDRARALLGAAARMQHA